MDFKTKLSKIIKKNNSLLCVGLDPEQEKFKTDISIFEFCRQIIDQTSDLVCAYKPNIAFFEALGLSGMQELKKTIEYLKSEHPQIPVVLDAKRADVPNTARLYAKSLYEYWQADSATVYPNLGMDSVVPFLEYKDKLTILLIKTSNEDSKMFQDLQTKNEKPYFLAMSEKIATWDKENIGIMVGSTHPEDLANVRKIFPSRIFLSPGFGLQGAQVEEAVKAGIDENGEGIMFNASRSIIYSQDPQSAAEKLRDEINKYR